MSDLCDSVQSLAATIAKLRSPEGCPWDREQTLASLTEHLEEEVCELLESVDEKDHDNFEEELGDLALLLLMYARIAEEEGITDFAKACSRANDKLIRRHPHVFAQKELAGGDPIKEVWKQWEQIKAEEKKSEIVSRKADGNRLKELPSRLPTLLKARDIFKDLSKKSLLDETELNQNTIKELSEGLTEETLGEILFEACAAARLAGLDPESALRRYVKRLTDSVNCKIDTVA